MAPEIINNINRIAELCKKTEVKPLPVFDAAALWKADKMDAKLAIADKKGVIGTGHVLTHDEDLISPEILWKIIEKNLPVLYPTILNNN